MSTKSRNIIRRTCTAMFVTLVAAQAHAVVSPGIGLPLNCLHAAGTDGSDLSLAERAEQLWTRYLDLRESLRDPELMDAARRELQQLADPEVVREFALRFRAADREGNLHGEGLNLIAELELKGLPAAESILMGMEQSFLFFKRCSEPIDLFDVSLAKHADQWRELHKLTRHPNEKVRYWAIDAGSNVLAGQPEATAAWYAMAFDTELPETHRFVAVRALGLADTFTDEQLAGLASLMKGPEEGRTWIVQSILINHGKQALPILVRLLDESDDSAQRDMLDCISRMGEAGQSASESILARFDSPNKDTQAAAMWCWWAVTHDAERLLPRLADELSNSPHLRLLALCGEMEAAASPVRHEVAAVVRAEEFSSDLSIGGLRALAAMGPQAKDELEVVRAALENPEVGGFGAAALAWAAISQEPGPAGEQLRLRLEACLMADPGNADDLMQTRQLLLIATRMKTCAAPAVDVLGRHYLKWCETPMKTMPLRALSSVGPEAIPVLEQLLASEQVPEAQHAALRRAIEQLR